MEKEKFVKLYAKAIQLSIAIREESFDEKAVEKAVKKYSQFYKKDLMQSVQEALKKVGLSQQLATPICLSMRWMDDIEMWSNAILGTSTPITDIVLTHKERKKDA